ncbi:MAG: amidohydrolase family protein [Peptococcaceae bacterium]|nr:amidohydrolase family protein [Peptococcaceae bacterium]
MGLAKGIFVVDTHVHAQRHAFQLQSRDVSSEFSALSTGMHTVETYANSDRLLYHMDRYGIDVSVIMPAFAMTNEIDKEIVKKHPDRMAAFVLDVETRRRDKEGVEPWNIKAAVAELERELETGMYVGVGEGLPGSQRICPGGWNERFEEICQIMELCRKYKVIATYHSGFPAGYAASEQSSGIQGHYECDFANPFLIGQVAAAYPDVPIILEHAGIEGTGYRTDIYDKCLAVARSHHNIYLECGQWWAELYERPLKDPNLGCERLVWGTDWGAASTPQSWMPGCVPETFCDQNINIGLPAHQIDIFGWALREVGRLNIPQDDLNLILGGNACRIMNIKTPFTRLFKQYIKK